MSGRGGRRQGILQKYLRQLTLVLHANEACRLHPKALKTRIVLYPREALNNDYNRAVRLHRLDRAVRLHRLDDIADMATGPRACPKLRRLRSGICDKGSIAVTRFIACSSVSEVPAAAARYNTRRSLKMRGDGLHRRDRDRAACCR